ncbi:MAG: AsnC family transcriptional regulator [Candidatus Thermoplasmatota archaeon]|nr:AsnC family transcriptional regulator [Candidatus Thermoplasmatota archaeon]
MDITDKKIIFSLLRDGRVPQRKIAMDVGISAQALNYRINRLIEEKIIKRFALHVNPALMGQLSAFAAFKTDLDYQGDVFSKIKCLEEVNLYGFSGKNIDDLHFKLSDARSKLGEPVMQYIPPERPIGMNINSSDLEIIGLLRKDPRMSVTDISSTLDLPYMTAKRRLNLLLKNHLIGVITELDLSGGDVVLYSIFSKSVEKVSKFLSPQIVFSIADQKAGVFTCFSENLKNAKESISRVREIDNSADVMILYDYQFLS